jgi:glucose-6-phosphate 1-epimerase
MKHTDAKILYGAAEALPLIVMEGAGFRAVIAVQGAQLLEYRSRGTDFLWLSPTAIFTHGQAIRGGIPICAPWFGVHPDNSKPKHGFVRNKAWVIEEQGQDFIIFSFQHVGDLLSKQAFRMTYKMQFGDALDLQMNIRNTGAVPMPFSWAFHSYHPVADLAAVRVGGLEGMEYLDATQGFKRIRQEGLVAFDGEIDRVYENVPPSQRIVGKPTLEISGENCPTAIVWNPGAALAGRMADVGEGYRDYICVERGAAFGDGWSLSGGAEKYAKLKIRAL